MRKTLIILAATSALAATPALAQVGVGLGGGVNTGVNVDTSRTVGDGLDTVGRTVDRTDRTVNRTLGRTMERELRVATSADVQAGASVRDSRGRRVGTVTGVSGGAALVVDNNRTYQVPLSALYRRGRGLVTNLSRAQLEASGSVSGSANGRGGATRREPAANQAEQPRQASGRGDTPY